MDRRTFIRLLGLAAASALPGASSANAGGAEKLNILLFTADDLHRDSLGCFGGKSPI